MTPPEDPAGNAPHDPALDPALHALRGRRDPTPSRCRPAEVLGDLVLGLGSAPPSGFSWGAVNLGSSGLMVGSRRLRPLLLLDEGGALGQRRRRRRRRVVDEGLDVVGLLRRGLGPEDGDEDDQRQEPDDVNGAARYPAPAAQTCVGRGAETTRLVNSSSGAVADHGRRTGAIGGTAPLIDRHVTTPASRGALGRLGDPRRVPPASDSMTSEVYKAALAPAGRARAPFANVRPPDDDRARDVDRRVGADQDADHHGEAETPQSTSPPNR